MSYHRRSTVNGHNSLLIKNKSTLWLTTNSVTFLIQVWNVMFRKRIYLTSNWQIMLHFYHNYDQSWAPHSNILIAVLIFSTPKGLREGYWTISTLKDTVIKRLPLTWSPTGDQTHGPGMCPDRKSNPRPLGLWNDPPTNWAIPSRAKIP